MKWNFDPDNIGMVNTAGYGLLDDCGLPVGITIHTHRTTGWMKSEPDPDAIAKAMLAASAPDLLAERDALAEEVKRLRGNNEWLNNFLRTEQEEEQRLKDHNADLEAQRDGLLAACEELIAFKDRCVCQDGDKIGDCPYCHIRAAIAACQTKEVK